jgi:transposase
MRDAIILTNSELMELTRRANSRTDRAEDARRARLILLLAEGHTWDEVSERIDCSRGFVASWSRRFTEQRIAGLYSRHLGQVATVLTPELEARILEATRHAPAGGATHWSTRKLGARLDVSHMMVARVWRKHGLQPHRMERYMASNDPDFETKAADVIGLYLNPPAHAAVFSVDEKTAIQALDRKDRFCRCPRDAQNGTVLSTFVTAPCRCTRPSTPGPAKCSAKPLRGTPRPNSSRSSPTL